MARYTGPKTKVSRRYGVPLFGPSKALERKNYPPGIHGPRGSRRKQSDYAIALGEKQKLRYQYGLLERQFRRIFERALRKRRASSTQRASNNLTRMIGTLDQNCAMIPHNAALAEFGHQLQNVLGKVPVRGLNGVAWDFVELPSQIMENWTWERASLDLLARHYQTGAAIPEDLFQKLVRARTFRAANAQMRQLSLGAVDLALHVDYDEKRDGNMLAYARKIQQRFTPAAMADDYAMVAGFTHIFSGGYACGYYSYKWAEVLDADAFTRFQKEGIFSQAAGAAFRREILEKGNLEEAGVLFRNFMGRDPDPEALMRRNGLVKK